MPALLPADWSAIAAMATSGITLEVISKKTGIALSTLKSRSARLGWKRAVEEVRAQKEAAAVTAGKMEEAAGEGQPLVACTLADLNGRTKLNFAKATANAAEHAAGLNGAEALKQARNIKEGVSAGATLHQWTQPGVEAGLMIVNIALMGRKLEELSGSQPIDIEANSAPESDFA